MPATTRRKDAQTMREETTTLAPLNISNTVYFLGTEAEQAEAEAKETARAAELAQIITAPDFIALEYINSYGQRRILHRSTRRGVMWQLSFIDPDGVPAMHENYVDIGGDPYEVGAIHTESELYRHFIHAGNNNPLTIKALYK